MNNFNLLKITFFYVMIACFLFSSCRPKLTKEEGEKQLRAFDNEMIVMSKQITESNAYRLLLQLNTIKHLPLPFQFGTAVSGKSYHYDFEASKGLYIYNKNLNEMIKSAPSDSIILIFPFQSEVDSVAKLVVTTYEEEQSVWNIMLPVKLEAKILLANHTVLNIHCRGEIKYGLPVDYKFEMEFSRFQMKTDLTTKLSRKKGRVEIVISILKDNSEIFKCKSNLITRMNEFQQTDYGTIKSKIEVFPLTIDMNINRDKIDAHTTHFIDDFNKNSSIWVYGNNGRTLIGKIKLKDRPNNDKLNPVIIYNDGSFEYLDELLFSVKQILNVKY
jgi:hypothetical protein